MSVHFFITSAEKQKADAKIDDRDDGLTVRRNRRLLLNQEIKELTMRPVLPWHVPLHGRCPTNFVGSQRFDL